MVYRAVGRLKARSKGMQASSNYETIAEINSDFILALGAIDNNVYVVKSALDDQS